MPYRKRNIKITLRMSENEFNFFKKRMEVSKQKTQTDFFLAVLRSKPIVVVESLPHVLTELKRQGNNLNQIARQLNDANNSINADLAGTIKECWITYKAISKFKEEVINAFVQGETLKGNPG